MQNAATVNRISTQTKSKHINTHQKYPFKKVNTGGEEQKDLKNIADTTKQITWYL